MSYPSGQQLMQQIVQDKSLPLSTRLQAAREPSFRPSLSFLLRLINDPETHAKLRAAAVIRYNQILAIKEMTRHARRDQRNTTPKPSAEHAAIDAIGTQCARTANEGAGAIAD